MLKTAMESDYQKLCVLCADSAFGSYIVCRATAYGFDKSFAKIFICENESGEITGAVSLLDNNAVVVAKENCNFEELSFFVASFGFSSILTDSVTAKKCGFQNFEIKPVLCFEGFGEDFKTDSSPEMKSVYELFCSSFPDSYSRDKNSYLTWLSDYTYRKNRGCCRLKAICDSETVCAAALTCSECPESAVISSVACNEKYRKKGYGKAVTISLANELRIENKKVYVISQDDNTTVFYQKIGFKICGEAAYIERL